jgi:hypothetical protein
MHAPHDRSRQSSYRTETKSGVGFFILPAVVAFVLIALVTLHPKASVWISQAVEAEFGGSGLAEDLPVQTARPDMAAPVRTVGALQ